MMNGAEARVPAALSDRERTVIELLAVGHTDQAVADRIGISLGTVRVYRKRIEAKTGVPGLARCLLVLWRFKLIDLDALADEVVAQRNIARRD